MNCKRIHAQLLVAFLLLYFGLAGAVETVQVKVVKNGGDHVLIVSSPFVIEGAAVSPCKIHGRTEECYVLRKAEGALAYWHPQGIEKTERTQVVDAARQAGLSEPFKIARISASEQLQHFEFSALTPSEYIELKKLDVRSPLCGRGDGSPLVPCPVRPGTQFGRLLAKEGGCLWSPVYGVPATPGQAHGPFVGASALRCSADEKEWSRIQRSALPR